MRVSHQSVDGGSGKSATTQLRLSRGVTVITVLATAKDLNCSVNIFNKRVSCKT